MLAFAIVVLLGIGIGYARGGSVRNLSGERLALLPLVWIALGMQIGAQFVPASVSIVAYGLIVISFAMMFAFAGANWRVGGMLLVALGSALNYAVILANGGMPVSRSAAARAGFVGEQASSLLLRGKHFLATSDARLEFLGDRIVLWRQPALASIGDLIIWAGLIVVIQALMQPRRRRVGLAPPSVDEAIDIRDEVLGRTPR